MGDGSMKQFQFSVSLNTDPLTEAKDAQGNVILSEIVNAETITQAMAQLDNWCKANNYRIFRAVRR